MPGYESKEWQARENYERQKGLFEKGIKSEKEIEYLKKDWEVAKADLEAAKQEVDSGGARAGGERERTGTEAP